MCCTVPLQTFAQGQTSANFLGVGTSHILDTYITQEKFHGIGFTYLNIREREKPQKRWNNIIEHEIDLSSTTSYNCRLAVWPTQRSDSSTT